MLVQQFQRRDALTGMRRQDQMTDDHALLHHTVAVKLRRADLREHFPDRRKRRADVVRRVRQPQRQRVVAVLEIRQVHVHQSVQQAQRFPGDVAAAVVDDRDLRTVNFQAFRHRLGKMVGCHQVDIVNAALF